MTDSNGIEVTRFQARHQGEALDHANNFDRLNGLTGSKLWVQQANGDWVAF